MESHSLSLLREKAIASTAIADNEFDFEDKAQPGRYLGSNAASRTMRQARRVSRGCLH